MKRLTFIVAALSAMALSACGSNSAGGPLKPVPVALTAHIGSAGVKVGVLFSGSSATADGPESDWLRAANGAELAAYRFSQAGTEVTIVSADDHATSTGAVTAMKDLIAQNVVGVVTATTGPHLTAALAVARAAHVAVIAPYEDATGAPGVWSTAPSSSAVAAHVRSAVAAVGFTPKRPLIITGSGASVASMSGATSMTIDGTDPTPVTRAIRNAIKAGRRFDLFIVAGSATDEAVAVVGIQGAGDNGVPIIAYPSATSPEFGTKLVSHQGSLAGTVTTVGIDANDSASLAQTEDGERLAAFYAAERLAATSSTLTSIFSSSEAFSTIAAFADTQSHDAVVALVRAAEAAHSTSPDAVFTALSKLRLSGAAGLAGPPLDFTHQDALDPTAVGILQSSDQDPNLRASGSTGETSIVYWFGTPAAAQQ